MAATSKLVDDFKESILEVWQRDGKTTWPIDLNSVSHLFIEDFDKDLLEDLEALQQLGLSKRQICRLFVIPQRIIRLIMPFVQGMGSLGLSREQRSEHVHYLLSLAQALKNADPSNRDGRNIVLSPEDSIRVFDDSRLAPADPAQSRQLHLLCGILWAYAETLFFKTHGLVREFHGPYQRPGEDRRFLVRDFVCLKPVEIWPECASLPCSNARIVTAYDQLDMSVDIYNHVSIPEGKSFVGSLHSYYVECDGRILKPAEMEPLGRDLSAVLTAVHSQVEAMDWQTRAQKYAEIFWYSKKDLRDRLKKDWVPPAAVKNRISTGELKTRHGNMSQKALNVMLRLSF